MMKIFFALALSIIFAGCAHTSRDNSTDTNTVINGKRVNNFVAMTIGSEATKVPPSFKEVSMLLSTGKKVSLFFVLGRPNPFTSEVACMQDQSEIRIKDAYLRIFGSNQKFSIVSSKKNATHILNMYCDAARTGHRTVTYTYNAKLIDLISDDVLVSDYIED